METKRKGKERENMKGMKEGKGRSGQGGEE